MFDLNRKTLAKNMTSMSVKAELRTFLHFSKVSSAVVKNSTGINGECGPVLIVLEVTLLE